MQNLIKEATRKITAELLEIYRHTSKRKKRKYGQSMSFRMIYPVVITLSNDSTTFSSSLSSDIGLSLIHI